jgi:hypothetical protein
MKKDRPGIALSVIAHPSDSEALESILFRETGTFGIRRQLMERVKLQRRPHSVHTQWGPIAGKLGWRTGESPLFTPEYEACADVARAHDIPLRLVYQSAIAAYAAQPAAAADVDVESRTAAPSGEIESPIGSHDHHHDHAHDHHHDHGHDHHHDHHRH